MRALAKAKINVDLHVLGKQADGYHALLSEVCFAEDIADVLSFRRADALNLKVKGEFASLAGAAPDNLVLKAAKALNAHVGTSHGARITVRKNIPVGAGLGGGSADAAATLRSLNELWKLHLPMDVLEAIALPLGADVPMCLHSVALTAQGRGEQLTIHSPSSVPFTRWYVVVFPNVSLATADVFRGYQRDPMMPVPDGHVRPLWNDLEYTARQLCPTVGQVLDALQAFAASDEQRHQPRMTGSGTACFMMLESKNDATKVAKHLAKHQPGWWARVTKVL